MIDMRHVNQAIDEQKELNGTAYDFHEKPSPAYMQAALAVLKNSFKIILNANDLFYWACADATEVEGDDIPVLLEAIERFGVAGEVAFQWKARGMKETVNCLERRSWKDQYGPACEWIKGKMLEHEYEARKKQLKEEFSNEPS